MSIDDLLSQLIAVLVTAETNRVDAERWHHLIDLLGALGYGSRITPGQIASLVPDTYDINEIIAATREVEHD